MGQSSRVLNSTHESLFDLFDLPDTWNNMLLQRRRLKKFSQLPLPIRAPTKSPSELLLELPDTEEDIASQERGLEHFSLFPDLPMELRLAIWRSILPPPRLFNLENECSRVFQDRRSRRRQSRLPITLRINRESREETLRHYDIVYLHKPGRGASAIVKPMLFGPRRDMIFIHSVHDFLSKPFIVYSISLAVKTTFRAKIPLNGIRELTILDARWDDKEKFVQTLMLFPGLKKLNLIEVHDGNVEKWFQSTEKEGGVEFRRDLLKAAEERRMSDLGGWSCPEIIMLPHQRVSMEIRK
jgi:hypothetical protein